MISEPMKYSYAKRVYSAPTVLTGALSSLLELIQTLAYLLCSLDRTNFVQDIVSRAALEVFLGHVRPEWISSTSLWSYHRELWAENGDALSRIYAGTGALNTSYTRSGKRTLAGQSLSHNISAETCVLLTYFALHYTVGQVYCRMRRRVCQGRTSTISKTRENKSLSTCSSCVPYLLDIRVTEGCSRHCPIWQRYC